MQAADGLNRRIVTKNGGWPAFSRNGKALYFHRQDAHGRCSPTCLCWLDQTHSRLPLTRCVVVKPHRVTKEPGFIQEHAASTWITLPLAFQKGSGGNFQPVMLLPGRWGVFQVDLEGGHETRLTPRDRDVFTPATSHDQDWIAVATPDADGNRCSQNLMNSAVFPSMTEGMLEQASRCMGCAHCPCVEESRSAA